MLSSPASFTWLSIWGTVILLLSSVRAEDFDCHVSVKGLEFDLTALRGEHTATSEVREFPPTSYKDTARINLCEDLATLDGTPAQDQCSSGTRVCLTTSNLKEGSDDRIVTVIPIVQSSGMDPTYSVLDSPKGVNIVLHGPSYPKPDSNKPQSLSLNILCDLEAENSEPKFKAYDGSKLELEWTSKAGCNTKEDPGSGDDGSSGGDHSGDDSPSNPPSGGSGIGWFFLVLLLAIVAYFVLGAYYNYTTYGASGSDLIPHRDFWKEVPYMLRDVASHLCNVRPRRSSSRGGYISV